jgi:methyltransferase (TIGR00027 family)
VSRTDKDTWDLASSVGATATAVAASRAMASQGPDPLLNDSLAAHLVRAVGDATFIELVDAESSRTRQPALDRRTIREQIAVRTRFYDEYLWRATESGIQQVVILASGLDTRAYRLPWPAARTVYEIDQPEVIAFKTRTLAQLGAQPTTQCVPVAIDLRDDWPDALIRAGFNAQRATAWCAEGLLIYLSPGAQDGLFDCVTALSAPGSRIATEHMDLRDAPPDWAERLTERSRRLGSNINLAELFYTDDRNTAADYLQAHRWCVDVSTNAEVYASNGFVMPDDELGCFGNASGYLTATYAGPAE